MSIWICAGIPCRRSAFPSLRDPGAGCRICLRKTTAFRGKPAYKLIETRKRRFLLQPLAVFRPENGIGCQKGEIMKRRITTIMFALMLSFVILFAAACDSGASKESGNTDAAKNAESMEEGEKSAEAAEESANAAEESAKAAEDKSEDTSEEINEADADTVEIIDAAGRTVTIPTPENLTNVYPDGTTGLILMYTLAEDMMVASPVEFYESELPYVSEDVIGLPFYGTMSGKNGSLNYEAIMAAGVDLILAGTAGDITSGDIEEADEVQEQLNIPVVIFDTANIDQMPETYRLLGQILGREEEAEEITDYLQGIEDKVVDFVATIPEEERMTLYYAEGSDGLATEPASSDRSIVFNMAGAINIAEVEALGGFGQSEVSMEQILDWNPEIIICQTEEGYDTILSEDEWANITAVKEGRVYTMPGEPFSWADRPPSENRFIGLLWMTKLLYGDEFDIDLVEETITYYDIMYHVTITEEDVSNLLATSMPEK